MRPQRARPGAGALPWQGSSRQWAVALCGVTLGASAIAAAPPPSDARTAAATATPGCRLLLSEHRSGRPLQALPLATGSTALQVAFVHSVLGTPVTDHYRFRPGPQGQWQAHLEAEQFEGEGYGLPYTAEPGEQLVRDGAGWRLTLDRVVQPLVVLPLPSQNMRLLLPGQATVLLGALTHKSVLFTLHDCPPGD